MKYILGALLCLSVCECGLFSSKYDPKDGRHNITMGQRRYSYPADTLLFHDNPRLEASTLRTQSYDVCYPPAGSNNHHKFTITAFNVTDVMPRGEGGYAFITKGGINYGLLCLHLKTQRGYGYNFKINIWGYYI